MKHGILLIFLLHFLVQLNGQNLVPNPSFEQTSGMPYTWGQWNLCNGWSNVTGLYTNCPSPDYFNLFGSGLVSLPQNYFSHIYPFDGNGIMGFVTWNGGNDYREYIDCNLLSPMQAGVLYRISFNLSIGSDYHFDEICNNLGFVFSNGTLTQQVSPAIGPIAAVPQIETSSIFGDSAWHRYTFYYTPPVDYTHLTIGNFRDDASSSAYPYTSGNILYMGCYLFMDSITIRTTFQAFSDTTICAGDSVLLHAVGASQYSWYALNDPSNILSTDSTLVVAPSQTTTYAIDGGGTNHEEVTVTIQPDPTIQVSPDTLLCKGQSVTLNSSCTDCDLLMWSNGNATDTLTVNATGIYVAIASNSCESVSDSVQVTFAEVDPLTIGDSLLCSQNAVLLQTNYPDATFFWNTGETSSIIIAPKAGFYSVVATIFCGQLSDSITVTIPAECAGAFIPNAFTPNHDGVNDVFEMQIPAVRTFHFQIFDRWGAMIFESSDPDLKWDGTWHGVANEMGVYVYNLKAETITGALISIVGNITLLR